MDKFNLRKTGNNLKELFKTEYEIIACFENTIVLSKGLHRIVFNIETDEIRYTYILDQ